MLWRMFPLSRFLQRFFGLFGAPLPVVLTVWRSVQAHKCVVIKGDVVSDEVSVLVLSRIFETNVFLTGRQRRLLWRDVRVSAPRAGPGSLCVLSDCSWSAAKLDRNALLCRTIFLELLGNFFLLGGGLELLGASSPGLKINAKRSLSKFPHPHEHLQWNQHFTECSDVVKHVV